MKLTKTERISLCVTAVMLFIVTAVFMLGDRLSPEPEVSLREIPDSVSAISSAEDNLININTAGTDELCSLKGIGPVLAEKIISYRNDFGSFTHTSDIIDVSGIGLATYRKIAQYICT